MPRPQTLTAKERKFIKELMSGKSASRAAIAAGWKSRTSGIMTIKKPIVQTAMQAALEKAGLSDSRLAKKFSELLDAKRKAELGKEIVDVDDSPTQLKTAVEVCKLKNSYPAEQVEVSGKLSLEQILSQSNDDSSGQ